MNIYVSRIPFKASNEELKELFSAYGEISSARIIMDRETGRSRGFGFVEMPDEAAARQAIENLNGASFMGMEISVSEAQERKEGGRPSGGGYNRGGGGGYGRNNDRY